MPRAFDILHRRRTETSEDRVMRAERLLIDCQLALGHVIQERVDDGELERTWCQVVRYWSQT